jgi:hypothetical protein
MGVFSEQLENPGIQNAMSFQVVLIQGFVNSMSKLPYA